ncbi:TonB family protein [Rhodocyclus tenuis]|uniref:TonB family protein n=1 Tax=Rhodocyclus gracilis TaxID=2929842 RepID=A0ABX0WLF0_9RHOO|nr:energy transducer TonB [Rhodocyclus gracilis]NJA90126.1 TonB family protein [Rhodocyclus gracilis]
MSDELTLARWPGERRPAGADAGGFLQRHSGLLITLALHGGLIWGLLQFEGVRQTLSEAAPLMVSLITPQQVDEAPKPLPQQATPHPVRQPVAAPLLATTAPTNSANAPAPTIATPAPAEPVVAVEAPLEPPRFSAAYLHNPPPPYPGASKRFREEGNVQLRVHVNESGAATTVEIFRSSGFPRLDQAAQAAVAAWRFTPAKRGELHVAAWVIVPITFNLEN